MKGQITISRVSLFPLYIKSTLIKVIYYLLEFVIWILLGNHVHFSHIDVGLRGILTSKSLVKTWNGNRAQRRWHNTMSHDQLGPKTFFLLSYLLIVLWYTIDHQHINSLLLLPLYELDYNGFRSTFLEFLVAVLIALIRTNKLAYNFVLSYVNHIKMLVFERNLILTWTI